MLSKQSPAGPVNDEVLTMNRFIIYVYINRNFVSSLKIT